MNMKIVTEYDITYLPPFFSLSFSSRSYPILLWCPPVIYFCISVISNSSVCFVSFQVRHQDQVATNKKEGSSWHVRVVEFRSGSNVRATTRKGKKVFDIRDSMRLIRIRRTTFQLGTVSRQSISWLRAVAITSTVYLICRRIIIITCGLVATLDHAELRSRPIEFRKSTDTYKCLNECLIHAMS